MNVPDAAKTQALLKALQTPENTREALRIALVEKALESQREEAAELLRQLQGKGQIIDIRV